MPALELSDITIVGGGPSGLFGAFYAGMRKMSIRIIDSLPQLGGQLAALYPEKYIYDMPGFPKVLAKELVTTLVEQAEQFKPEIILNQSVVSLKHASEEVIELTTSTGDTILTRTALICGGVGAFTPRTLKVDGVEEYVGSSLFYSVTDRERLRDKRVMIVGGGDTATDWALQLSEIAESITLIHRRDVFRAHEDSISQLLNSDVNIKLFRELKTLHGNGSLSGVTIFDNRTHEEEQIETDVLLVTIGFLADLGPIGEWGINLEKNSIIVDTTMSTNLPGVFAAGDICTYPGKLKLIATGVGEAATAVNHAKHYIDPSAKINPGHSSDMDKSASVRIDEALLKS